MTTTKARVHITIDDDPRTIGDATREDLERYAQRMADALSAEFGCECYARLGSATNVECSDAAIETLVSDRLDEITSGDEWIRFLTDEGDDGDELVTIEEMPDHLRGSHRAAGNWGRYPLNGAERREVTRAEAEEIVAADDDGYDHIVCVSVEADEDEDDQGVDADGDCIACGHPANGSSGHGSCEAPCHTQSPSEWYRPGKGNVATWDTVASYVATFPTEEGEGACDVEVQVGEAGGEWYLRTTDDAGGSDDCDDTAYATREDAVAAAETFADERNEALPGEDAEDFFARKLTEAAGEPVADGEWCVYWSTSLEDSGPRERYETEQAATAACEIANVDIHAAHPGGNLLCGFEVRRLVHGEWITEEMQDENDGGLS